jgi:lipoprotein-anchoring transpeptidase ErfK/SrfK
MKKESAAREVQSQLALKPQDYAIVVSISEQKLYLIKQSKILKKYAISTSKYGVGNKEGSNKTPLGTHCIVSKIGRNARCGEIIKSRRRTGRIAKKNRRDRVEDVITTRILRLKGLKPGINKGKGIDSYRRCIYIHGTPVEDLIGKPASHGCIRMRNRDVIELFDLVARGTLVDIQK